MSGERGPSGAAAWQPKCRADMGKSKDFWAKAVLQSAPMRVALAFLLLLSSGCSAVNWLRPSPTPILPAEELYQIGENEMGKRRYEEARKNFRRIVERHPNSSLAARARFLIGEAFYREAEFDKAAKEFETFMAFYPRHQIADLVQYRLANEYGYTDFGRRAAARLRAQR